ncbi:MAG: hypothetical protein STSR0004_19010 [Peptococcaceae bacterium]
MIGNVSSKLRAVLVGILIIVAYSMLTYGITKNVTIGVITDVVSGLAVIGIAVLMFPVFNFTGHKLMNLAYLLCRCIEGILIADR